MFAADIILQVLAAHGDCVIVPESQVVVEAWAAKPAVFGMRPYRHRHPDSKRVGAELANMRRLRLIDRPAPCCVRLTKAGWARAKAST